MATDVGVEAPPVLGIIAGSGGLPGQLIRECLAKGRPVFVVALEGFADPDTLATVPHAWSRMAAAGRVIKLLHDHNVSDVVMAGAVRRPSLSSLRPDARGMRIVQKLLRGGQGDDSILGILVAELESEGFRVVGAADVIDTLVRAEGLVAGPEPSPEAWQDIRRGLEVLEALSPVDVGQAVVVQQGIVLGIEAVEGTDGLLERVGGYRREGQGGVLVKVPKRDQDRRADMPTIGPVTMDRAASAGLCGVALGAGETMLLEAGEVEAAANRHGLFVVCVTPERR